MRYFAAFFVSVALVSAADFRNGQAAWAVLGQPSFGGQSAPPSQSVAGTPGGLAWANGKLLVSDGNRVGATTTAADGTATQGNRVLIFNAASGNYLPDPRSDVSITGNVYNTRCPVCGFPASSVLGQADFNGTGVNAATASNTSGSLPNGMRNPTAVASDGTVVAVADTDNNRVLIWKTFPTTNGQPPDLALGQKDLNSVQAFAGVHNNTLRGPQGVWIQNGKVFVADTQNYRVLIWNSIPTQSGQAADLVIGQKDFESADVPANDANNIPIAAANRLYSPTSVTSDGTRMYVADLGFNRVLIWNAIPTVVDQPADVEIGQPDFVSTIANNSSALCASNGTNSTTGALTYPTRCEKTINFPRYALSDGQRLFVADSGNDRVLIFNTIPTANAPTPNTVLGQPDFASDIVDDTAAQFASTYIPNIASTNTVRTPTSLAWDGTNLYVADPYDLRVMVFTPGDNTSLADNSILNAASLAIFQEGVVTLGGSIHAGDTTTITAGAASTASYTYTVKTGDTLDTVAQGLATAINSSNSNVGDPNVLALANGFGQVLLTSRQSQLANDTITLTAAVSTGAQLTATASGGYLTGGNAAVIAPGTIVVINGQNLTNGTTAGTMDATANTLANLPRTLAGSQVIMDGSPAPLLYASPNQIIAQVPYTFSGANSASIYVRTVPFSGPAQISNAAPIIIAAANPGIFAGNGNEPRPAIAVHSSAFASAVVSVDGTIKAGDTGTITVGGTAYTYTVKSTDTLVNVRDGLIALIGADSKVTPSAGGQFTRVVLTAKQSGSAGNGISVAASTSANAVLTLSAYSSSTCCASTPGAPVTSTNPAQPNETITLIATGLGALANGAAVAGAAYNGTIPNTVTDTVSATVAGSTAQVINAQLGKNAIGLYSVDMIMPASLSADPNAQIYIAQDAFVSNIATLPVAGSGNPLVTFTATPNVVITATGLGQTTLNWNAPGIQNVEIHVNSPNGPTLAAGGPTGSITTGNWVTDGMSFYLEDVTNGKTPSTVNTLTSLVVRLGTPQDVTSFSATDVNLPKGYSSGPTTLTWAAPTTNAIEIHVNAQTGPLLTASIGSGSVTTGNWVVPGTTFYLLDVQNSSAPVLLKTAQPKVNSNAAPAFTINPTTIYAPYSPAGYLGTATINWNSPLTANVEVHINAPNGPLFTAGGSSGNAVASGWVTNGTVFYLQDVSNGFPLNSDHTLAAVTAQVLPQQENGYLLLSQNPIQIPTGQTTGSATLNWASVNATTVEVHVNAPNGPLVTGGGPQGTGTASGWVTAGTVFYLQDRTNGAPLTPQFTIAAQTVASTPLAPNTSFQASSNPILVPVGTTVGATNIYWNAPGWVLAVEVHVGSPSGPLVTAGTNVGSVTTGDWVVDGTTFYLQDVTKGKALTWPNNLGTVTVHLQQLPGL